MAVLVDIGDRKWYWVYFFSYKCFLSDLCNAKQFLIDLGRNLERPYLSGNSM